MTGNVVRQSRHDGATKWIVASHYGKAKGNRSRRSKIFLCKQMDLPAYTKLAERNGWGTSAVLGVQREYHAINQWHRQGLIEGKAKIAFSTPIGC